MKTTIFWISVLTAFAAVAIAFAARERTLFGIRAENEGLRQQLSARPTVPAPEPPAQPATNGSIAQLTSDEQRELLRLRGQVQPLRRELQDLTNRIAMAGQRRTGIRNSADPVPPMSPEAQARFQAMRAETEALMATDRSRNAQRMATTLSQYVKEHGGSVPNDLAELERLANPPLPEGFCQQFELLRSDPIPGDMASSTLLVREKEPQRVATGLQMRLYHRSDGAIQFKQESRLP